MVHPGYQKKNAVALETVRASWPPEKGLFLKLDEYTRHCGTLPGELLLTARIDKARSERRTWVEEYWIGKPPRSDNQEGVNSLNI